MTSNDMDKDARVVPFPAVKSEEITRQETGVLGLSIFLGSLAVLFIASIVGYLIVRLRAEEWIPEGAPSLPSGLWVSTIIILASSVTVQWALNAARRNEQKNLIKWMLVTDALGLLFLILQIANWWSLIALNSAQQANLYAFTFFMLTGLHAAHVIGGLIPMGITTWKAYKKWYSPSNHSGVLYCVMYWHFLDAVWLILFVILMIFS